MTNEPARVLGMALTSEQARNGADEIEVLLVQEQVHVMCFLPVRCHVGWGQQHCHTNDENIDRNGGFWASNLGSCFINMGHVQPSRFKDI